MRKAFVLLCLAVPLFAGALTLDVTQLDQYPEAKAKGAVFVVRTTACVSPEKTVMTATAEGVVDGNRRSLPLRLIALKEPGTYAVTREWPDQGSWVVKVVATNPDYKGYTTSTVVRVAKGNVEWASAAHIYHAPTAAEVTAVLGQ